jgi:hypothetical protein
MSYLPRGVAQPKELTKCVNKLAPWPPEFGVVNWRWLPDSDWNGDPAIFFWITLSDEAADPAILPQNTRPITDYIKQKVDPVGRWDLIPYVNFRSQSEQEKLKEEVFG